MSELGSAAGLSLKCRLIITVVGRLQIRVRPLVRRHTGRFCKCTIEVAGGREGGHILHPVKSSLIEQGVLF